VGGAVGNGHRAVVRANQLLEATSPESGVDARGKLVRNRLPILWVTDTFNRQLVRLLENAKSHVEQMGHFTLNRNASTCRRPADRTPPDHGDGRYWERLYRIGGRFGGAFFTHQS
jgi:hypothetical protein